MPYITLLIYNIRLYIYYPYLNKNKVIERVIKFKIFIIANLQRLTLPTFVANDLSCMP